MKTFSRSLFAAAFGLLACTNASAAIVTWGSPQNETGSISDIIAAGALVDAAVNNPSSQTVNGVAFKGISSFSGGTVAFTGSNIVEQNMADSHESFGAGPPGSFDSAYAALVRSGGFANSGGGSKYTIGGLTSGQAYVIQIIEAYWDQDLETQFGTTSGSPVALQVGTGSNPAQYVVGSFTADSNSQVVQFNGTSAYAIAGAIEVRAAVPEPGTLGLLVVGGLAVSSLLLRERA